MWETHYILLKPELKGDLTPIILKQYVTFASNKTCTNILFTSVERFWPNKNYTEEPENPILRGPNRGHKACYIMDEDGNIICAGERCGAPTGNCGPRLTACECAESGAIGVRGSSSLSKLNLNADDFIRMWNAGGKEKEYLITNGFYEKDKK